MSTINKHTKLFDLLSGLTKQQLNDLNTLINTPPSTFLFLNENSKKDDDVANYISNKLNANYIKVQLLSNSILTGFTIPSSFYMVTYTTDNENVVLYEAKIDNDLFLGLNKLEDENISILEIKSTIGDILTVYSGGAGGVTIDDFDDTLFAEQNGKISLQDVSKENDTVSIDTDVEISGHTQLDGSLEAQGTASFKDAVEVQEPTADGNPATKKYVDGVMIPIIYAEDYLKLYNSFTTLRPVLGYRLYTTRRYTFIKPFPSSHFILHFTTDDGEFETTIYTRTTSRGAAYRGVIGDFDNQTSDYVGRHRFIEVMTPINNDFSLQTEYLDIRSYSNDISVGTFALEANNPSYDYFLAFEYQPFLAEWYSGTTQRRIYLAHQSYFPSSKGAMSGIAVEQALTEASYPLMCHHIMIKGTSTTNYPFALCFTVRCPYNTSQALTYSKITSKEDLKTLLELYSYQDNCTGYYISFNVDVMSIGTTGFMYYQNSDVITEDLSNILNGITSITDNLQTLPIKKAST